MKAFIFVALVATVAARNLDLDTLRLLKEKSLLTRPVVDDVLLKEKLDQVLPIQDRLTTPVLRKELELEGVKGIYERDFDRVYSFEELYQTELFREYLRLPLFAKYIQYPSFQRYVASLYFQKFWQVPAFQQYFLNPVYFYKYIYPQVQLFHSEYQYPVEQYYGQDVYGTQDLYNTRYGLPTTFTPGQYYPYNYNQNTYGTTNYKFLLDKIYKTLFVNQPVVGDLTQVKTDVKILPGDKKVVVEPITGERKLVVEEPKIVDVKVDQKIVPVESVLPVEKKIVDDVLITDRDHLLLKVLLKERVITPEIYEQIIRGQVQLTTVLREIYGQHVDITDVIRQVINRYPTEKRIVDVNDVLINDREVLLVKYLLKENVITPEIYEQIIRGQVELSTVLRQIYGRHVDINELIRHILNRREVALEDTALYNLPTYNRFDRFERRDIFNRFDRFNKYNTYNTYNKYNKYTPLYNTEIPTLRDNIYNYERLPIEQVLGNIVA